MSKITVTSIDETGGWKPADAGATFKPIFTLAIKEKSEPIKTQDASLNVLGEHEAYEKPAKSGKMYWHSGTKPDEPRDDNADAQRWGNSLNVASRLVAATTNDWKDAKEQADKVIELARYLYHNATPEEPKDEVTDKFKEMVEPAKEDLPPF